MPFDLWITGRETVNIHLGYKIDIGSAPNFNSPKCLIVANQTESRIGVPNKVNNIAIIDSLNVRKYHVDIDGV